MPALEIAPNDPIIAYFQRAPSVVEIEELDLDSPALASLIAAGVTMVVPLVSQGELIGLLNLGPRRSEQDYSADDLALLNNLAGQAAPAVRVAQLVQQQKAEALARERIEQELRVARSIQLALLPRDVPALPGWELSAYYQPAREVGGDFYDFLSLSDGRVGLIIGDVADKGVPAALLMATTRSVLRAFAQELISPGMVLERVNDFLCPDIPPRMFVTCLYAVLDPADGRLQYANAGHGVPYRQTRAGVVELDATGVPIGLLPGMRYEEHETTLAPGERVLFYSDGLVEAHNTAGEMFGFPRLRDLLGSRRDGAPLIELLLAELAAFTGAGWEQEDDVTLVTLRRRPSDGGDEPESMRTLVTFTLPSEPGVEHLAMERVAEAVRELHLSARRLERLKTAVAEATMNAVEHGNQYRADAPVTIRVLASASTLAVAITDQGGGRPVHAAEIPDLDAKLEGRQSPRGWGLFLIKNLVDEMRVTNDAVHHTIELILQLEGDERVSEMS
ncbi:MAG: SpoIIE family protein phosphatase [Chloroflexi bacterium]|nr:SpoIIE family protein phosphatase [Chloroflexota bacterium]